MLSALSTDAGVDEHAQARAMKPATSAAAKLVLNGIMGDSEIIAMVEEE